jgi:hypothetical protein
MELSETSKPKETLDHHMMYFKDLNAQYMPEAGGTSDKRDPRGSEATTVAPIGLNNFCEFRNY